MTPQAAGARSLDFQAAVADDAAECVRARAMTRENAIPEERLRAIGITAESWASDIRSGAVTGVFCRTAGSGGRSMVGYCFGDPETGEILVLVVLPEFEGAGLGRRLLGRVVGQLERLGHRRLFLGCSPDPGLRSHGFYRHLGWRNTGLRDKRGDEVLELLLNSAVE